MNPLESSLATIVQERTNRQIYDTHTLSRLMVAPLSVLGSTAMGVSQDIANAMSGEKIYRPTITPSILPTVNIFADTAERTNTLPTAQLGALLILGALNLAYDPRMTPKSYEDMRKSAYTSAAKEIMRNLKPQNDSARGIQADILNLSMHRSMPENYSFDELFLGISEQLITESDSLSCQVVNNAASLAIPETNSEAPLMLTETDRLHIAKIMPWLDVSHINMESDFPTLHPEFDNNKLVAFTVDLSAYNETTQKITKEASETLPEQVTAMQKTALSRMIERRLVRVRNVDAPLYYHKNIGSNHRIVRVYYAFIGSRANVPVIAHVGTCRTKSNEQKMLQTFVGNSQRVSKKSIEA